jgi:hypothetical protein
VVIEKEIVDLKKELEEGKIAHNEAESELSKVCHEKDKMEKNYSESLSTV